MKLASVRDGTPDGQLVVVSRDLRRAVAATHIAHSLRVALETWGDTEAPLQALSDALNGDRIAHPLDFSGSDVAPPLPRAWQWLDASAFHSHGDLMERAFK